MIEVNYKGHQKKIFIMLFVPVLSLSQTVIDVTDHGAVPDDGVNDVAAINTALLACKNSAGATVLNFPTGTYDIWSEDAPVKVYHISNTISHEEKDLQSGRIGMHVVDTDDLTIEGNGSLLLFHNTFNNFVFKSCNNITMQNLRFDMVRPSMSEITVAKINSPTEIEFDVHEDTWYEINGGSLTWIGEDGWRLEGSAANLAQQYNADTERTWRTGFNPVRNAADIEEIAPRKIRCTYASNQNTSVGAVYQMRYTSRTEVFGLIEQCKNVLLKNIDAYFMHGFGIVAQYSENISYDSLWAAPEPGSGRTCSGSADYCQFSGNKGLISVTNSRFVGSHDDPINIHGTFLEIVGEPAPNKIQVRFMHPLSWGFEGFFEGDVIDFLEKATHLTYATRTVTAVQRDDDFLITLTLDSDNPQGIALNSDVVENVTYVPDVMISGNYFGASPVRGVLVTTRGNVVIQNNTFHQMVMPAIFVEDIIGGWYESGYIRNLTIYNNTFIEGSGNPIRIDPNNTDNSVRVHRGIRILENNFQRGSSTIQIRSSSGVYLKDNTSTGTLNNDFSDTDVINTVTYEAEAGTHLSGTATIVNHNECSDGQCVDGIGGSPENYLEIKNVYAPENGNYTLSVFCYGGMAETVFVNANDRRETSGVCNTGDWFAQDTFSVVVELHKGVGNSIKFYNNDSVTPYIDKIELVPGGILSTSPGPRTSGKTRDKSTKDLYNIKGQKFPQNRSGSKNKIINQRIFH